MCSSYQLPVRLLSNQLKLCTAKFTRVNVLSRWSVVNVVCRLEPARSTCSLTPGSVWLRPQNIVVRSWAALHKKRVSSDIGPVSDVVTDESAEACPDNVTRPLRKDRLEQQSLFREMIHSKGDAPWTDDDWLRVADTLPSASRESWEIICMHALYVDKNISLGQNLMSYIEKQGGAASLVVVVFYIGLLGESCAGLDEEAYKYYQYLLSRTSVLDAASIEVLINSLSCTRHYQECWQLLETCRETSNPSSTSLVQLLRAVLRNQDIDLCHRVLSEIEHQTDPSGITTVLPKVIDDSLSSNNQTCLEIVMNFIQKHSLLLKRAELEQVVHAFHRHQRNQWTANYGFINHHHGRCSVCATQMARSEVDSSDFQSIQATFLDQVIVGSNVFFKSSPEEVNSFVTFIQKKGPFDVVIDGLNVMYRGSRKPDAKQLGKVVKYFTDQGKKVLVLGTRMLTRYTYHARDLANRPAIYMTSTTKCDDAFFLYAALHSGKQTLVVSSDKLRDHKYLLKPSLRPIFHQWILSAQIYDWFISNTGEFIIGKRHLFVTGPARDDGGWHIPENDISAANPFGRHSVLCLRNKPDFVSCSETKNKSLRQTTSADTNSKSVRQTTSAAPGLSPPRRIYNRQTTSAAPGLSPTRRIYNRQTVAWSNKDLTDRTGGSGTKSSNTRSKSEKEWFDN